VILSRCRSSALGRENGQVGELARGDLSFDPKYARRTRRKSSTIRISESRPLCTRCSSCQRESRFEPRIPKGARSNSTSFNAGSCGAWSVAIASTVPSAKPSEQRFAIFARRQRRIHLEFRIVLHVLVDQREMMRRDFAGDAQPARFRPANLSSDALAERCATCSRAPVNSRAATSRADADGFRRRWHPSQPSRVEVTPSRITRRSQRNIFRMLNHRKIQRSAIIHHLPRELCRGDRFSIIRNADESPLLHSRDFGNRFAFAPHRRRANRPHANAPATFARSTMTP